MFLSMGDKQGNSPMAWDKIQLNTEVWKYGGMEVFLGTEYRSRYSKVRKFCSFYSAGDKLLNRVYILQGETSIIERSHKNRPSL